MKVANMRVATGMAASLLMLSVSGAFALDLGKKLGGSLLDSVNKSLAEQQVKDGQFEFKTGKAEFTPGNEKRVEGLLKVITNNSSALKAAYPKLYVTAEGHTDADGTAAANQTLSLARAKTVCAALKAKGLKMECKPSGVGSSKPLVSPEKSAADKQRNRRVLVQLAK